MRMVSFGGLAQSDDKISPIDFSSCSEIKKDYGGSEPKKGILFNGQNQMLKFRKVRDGVESFNHISEYLGSKIYEICGVPVHETLLGYYNGAEVVAVRDFVQSGQVLIEFNIADSPTLDHFGQYYTFSDIEERIMCNPRLEGKESVIVRFWQMFVVDAVLGNFDRHGCNWGYLLDLTTGVYKLAPVFDNGSCLFPSMREDEIDFIMSNNAELKKLIYTFPTSQILFNGRKSSYFEIINGGYFAECGLAVSWIKQVFNLDAIDAVINSCIFITDKRREMIREMVRLRYNCIIEGKNL